MTRPAVVGASQTNGDAPAGSVLAQLRQRAAAQRTDRHLDLPVGGAFGEHLVIRYGGLPVEELDRYSELAGSVTNLSLAIDMMVSCARSLLWREGGVDTDLAVGLGPELWELLEWPVPEGLEVSDLTPRLVVDALWHGRGMALGNHVGQLVSWQTEEDQTPGEASAPAS